MKKIALVAFSATALLALSACGGSEPAPEATDTAAATDAAATDAAADAAAPAEEAPAAEATPAE